MLELFAEPFSVMVQIVTDIILRKTGFIAQPTRPGQKKKLSQQSQTPLGVANGKIRDSPRHQDPS